MHIHEIFYEMPKSSSHNIEMTNPDIKNPYAFFVNDPQIRPLLIEIRNRDFNLQHCQIFCTNDKVGKEEYEVSYPSNCRKNTATVPEDLDLFCMIVSSAGRFEMIEQRVAKLKKGINW